MTRSKNPILPLLLSLLLWRQPFHSLERGTGRAKEGADSLDGNPERVARDKLRDGRTRRGPARRAATPAAMTNTRREPFPCGLTPWAALRSLAEGFASGPRSPSPSRLLQPAALLPTRRGGTSSPEERPGEQDPALGHAPSWSEPSVSLTAVWSARSGGWLPPANGAQRSPGVLVLAEWRAPWRPHTSRAFGLRSRRMGSTDSE